MKNFYLIVHNVRSARNVGAIFRTADGAGVSKIFLSGYTPAPYDFKKDRYETAFHRQISKTALGAEKNIFWEKYKNIGKLIEKLKKEKNKIYALEKTKGSENIFKAKINFPCALILGNEVKGINSKILRQCDSILEIPMRGQKESLNVSVAAGVAMYEILK